MLKIGEVVKSCTGRGKNSWLKKELIAEAKRRGIKIKSTWTKEQICDAITPREEKKENTGSEGKESQVVESGERKRSEILKPLEYKEGNIQYFAEQALKLGFNFKKPQKFKTYSVYFATHALNAQGGALFHPVKFREESKIQITPKEVKEMLLDNDFRAREGEE